MERRSWPWKRKLSLDKSPEETESSGSASSQSERCSDDQDALRASPISASPNHVQSPEMSSNMASSVASGTVKSLSDKLSAALSNIQAKECLVKQHAKVAEEAVSGWEKAETEVAALKQQLEAGAQKNYALEDRIGHLDGALKECVKQLRQSREDQELKIHEALIKKAHEWESEKSEIKSRLIELQDQLDARKVLAITSVDHDFQLKLEALEKENSSLKVELLAQSEDLQKQTFERELSNCAAETASKQHLESIKKVTKLEAECRRLRAVARKSIAGNDNKPLGNSVCVESLTDSQSDSGERLFGMDNEPSCSDSWASALIAELDQFKNEKALKNVAASSIEIDLMDDFLEMERLAALSAADHGSSSFELEADPERSLTKDGLSKIELEAMIRQIAELEEKIERMCNEKEELEMALVDTQSRSKLSCNHLIETDDKLVELQQQLNLTIVSKHNFEIEVQAVEAKRKDLESRLESANMEIEKLQEKMGLLEGKLEEKGALCAELSAKCHSVEVLEATKKHLESQLMLVTIEAEKLHDKVDLLERKVEDERALSTELAAECREMESAVAKSKELEAQFRSANLEIVELHVKLNLFEGKAKEESALSAEFAAKVEAVEAERRALKSQLELAYIESEKLHEKMGLLEREVEVARALSAEYGVLSQKSEAVEAERKALESQLNLAQMEARELREKGSLLEANLNNERKLSTKVVDRLAAVETRKRALESELESARIEIKRLHKRADLLEKEVTTGRELSAEYAIRCRDLEDKLSGKKQETEVQCPCSSNGELKTREEKELTAPSGKLEECRKTIASLGWQLKSLATFEDFMLEAEQPELINILHSSDPLKNIASSSKTCNNEQSTPTSSSSSSSGLEKILSPTRIDSHIGNR